MGSNKSSGQKFTLVHLLLISVIVLMAVIIAFMSTSMRAILDEDKQTPKNNNSGGDMNNIVTVENTTQNTTDNNDSGVIPTAEHIETPVQTSTEINAITQSTNTTSTTTTTKPAPETTAFTVSTEIINEFPIDTTTITTTTTTTIIITTMTSTIQNDYTEVYSDAYYACVNTQNDPLNIRSGAGQDYKITGTIPQGKYIDVYMTSNSNWYYTTYNGISGYVSADYITLILSEESDGDDDNYNNDYNVVLATVNTENDPLNMRDSASESGSIITTIPKGNRVSVNEYGDTWCYVTWGLYSGYVSTQYLEFP
ncbi:MAG: SH3 domain-containing protein [Ruminococcus sp.]|nr:SH3 domain-containing protein [Ruminococcus sp.]